MAAVEEIDFAAEVKKHQTNVPALDGYMAAKLELRFSGSGKLDPTSPDDVRLLEAARLGEPVRLIVVGEVSGKGFRLTRDSFGDGALGFACTVKVLSVEAGEIA